jgi:hypothetical protein
VITAATGLFFEYGAVWYVGLEPQERLRSLHDCVRLALPETKPRFRYTELIEGDGYSPHITLAAPLDGGQTEALATLMSEPGPNLRFEASEVRLMRRPHGEDWQMAASFLFG